MFNTDQGVQFTSGAFTSRLEAAGIRIRMDGRGRVFDNLFIERLWPTVKDEEATNRMCFITKNRLSSVQF